MGYKAGSCLVELHLKIMDENTKQGLRTSPRAEIKKMRAGCQGPDVEKEE